MPGRFSRHRLQKKPLVSDRGMHHGTCYVGIAYRGGGENDPSIPGACATRNPYLASGPCRAVRRNTRRVGRATLCLGVNWDFAEWLGFQITWNDVRKRSSDLEEKFHVTWVSRYDRVWAMMLTLILTSIIDLQMKQKFSWYKLWYTGRY